MQTAFASLRFASNSIFIAVVVTLANLVLQRRCGYAFARLRFPGREVLFLVVLATLMIPDQLRLVPVYLIIERPRVTIGAWARSTSPWSWSCSATNLFFMRQFFLTIPRDLEEAARLDGAGFFTTFRKVMLPLAGPALAAVTILTVPGDLERVLLAGHLASARNPDHYTFPLGIVARCRLPVPDDLATAHGGVRHGDPADRRSSTSSSSATSSPASSSSGVKG